MTLKTVLETKNIEISEKDIENLEKYRHLVLEWNKKFNITAITEENEFNIKHFLDCLMLKKLDILNKSKNIIDIGTGGGFPGLVLKLTMENTDFLLVDSLNKRIKFLNYVIEELGIKKVVALHARSEDLAKTKARESYDIAVSRAVAPLNTLTEYCLPFVKVGGYFVAMKGSNADAELEEAIKAIELLGGIVEEKIDYTLTDDDYKRSLIIIKKVNKTNLKYPRGQGLAKSKPIV